MSSKHVIACIFSSSLVIMSGCLAEPGEPRDEDPAEVGDAPQSLTNSPPTNAEPWIVNISFNGTTRCSGSVLTQHWLLTAAHCVGAFNNGGLFTATVRTVNAAGSVVTLYTGNARGYKNTYYTGEGDVDDDVAIIRLEAGAGVDLSITGKAKLWGYTTPWSSSSSAARAFTIIGYGLSDPDCAGSDQTKRIATGFVMDQTGASAVKVMSPFGDTHTCGGDSGAPWLLDNNGVRTIAAVHSGRYWDWGSLSTKQQAALLPPKMAWMYDASLGTSLKLVCAGECNEVVYHPEPPPGPPCPSGQHCCEPDGDVCLKCLPNNKACP